jgi:hypothetical protein
MQELKWESRSSWFLYAYQYLFLLAVTVGLLFIVPGFAWVPLVVALLFVIDAITMKYEVYDDHVSLSASLFYREATTVELKDVVAFHVLDVPPWNVFSLGTVILITDFTVAEHPCIKCIKDPAKLARLIRRLAIKQGASL